MSREPEPKKPSRATSNKLNPTRSQELNPQNFPTASYVEVSSPRTVPRPSLVADTVVTTCSDDHCSYYCTVLYCRRHSCCCLRLVLFPLLNCVSLLVLLAILLALVLVSVPVDLSRNPQA